MIIHPIETHYKGYRFRSRLEARWAVFFDFLGMKWDYEFQGFHIGNRKYLPDFWFPKLELWLEIKPNEPTKSEILLVNDLAECDHSAGIAMGLPGDKPVIVFCADQTDGSGGFGPWDGCRWCLDVLTQDYKLCSGDGFPSRDYIHNNGSPFPGLIGEGQAVHTMQIDLGFGEARSARFEHGESPAHRQHNRRYR